VLNGEANKKFTIVLNKDDFNIRNINNAFSLPRKKPEELLNYELVFKSGRSEHIMYCFCT